MTRPQPPELPAILQAAPLEARDALSPGELHELNGLRIQMERWPEINGALAHAYLCAPSFSSSI